MLIIQGYIHIPPADVDDFIDATEAVGHATRQEAGCLFYAIALDERRTGRFLVSQRWRDRHAIAAHLARATTKAFLGEWQSRMQFELQDFEGVEPVS